MMDDVACCVLIQVGVRCAGGSKSSIKGAEVLVAMRHGQSLFRYLDDAQPCSLKAAGSRLPPGYREGKRDQISTRQSTSEQRILVES